MAKLKAVRSVRYAELQRRVALEQSIRPTGPWLDDLYDVSETRSFAPMALRQVGRYRGASDSDLNAGAWAPYSLSVAAGRSVRGEGANARSGGYAAVATTEESLALGPERILITAAAAPDLRLEPDRMLHGYAQTVLAFSWNGAPVRLFVSPTSHLPSAVEIVRPRPYELFWSPWGDVDSVTDWELWLEEPDGLRLPRQWTTESNGQVERVTWIDKVEIDPTNAPTSVFADIPAPAARTIEESVKFDPTKRQTVAPGIQLFPGPWNVLEVDSEAGVYVIEGPISNAYSAAVLADLQRRGRPLLGVITTSDAWPHIGGLREYVAQGVPIYALDLNRPILERLFAAPHGQRPDRLARTPKTADLHLVDRPRTLGHGPDTLQLIPLRTAAGERQLAIYFPTTGVLYTSDLFSVLPDGTVFTPQFLSELAGVVDRERLAVKTVVGMHYGPLPWADLQAKLRPNDT